MKKSSSAAVSVRRADDQLRHAVGDRRVDRVLGDVALDPEVVVVALLARQAAALALHLVEDAEPLPHGLLGFLADGNWIINYPKSLLEFKDVSACKLCLSLPLTLANLAGLGFDQAFIVSLALLIAFSMLLIRLFPRMNASLLIGLFTCMALLINPYLQNYDFAFAVVPLFILTGIARTRIDWVIVSVTFLLPWLGLIFLGRDGNITLLISTMLMTAALLTNVPKAHTIAATT